MRRNMLGMNMTEWRTLAGLSDPYSLELAKISAEAGVPRVLSEQERRRPQGQTTTGSATPQQPSAPDSAEPAATTPSAQTTSGSASPEQKPASGQRKERPLGFGELHNRKVLGPKAGIGQKAAAGTALGAKGGVRTLFQLGKAALLAPGRFARGVRWGAQDAKSEPDIPLKASVDRSLMMFASLVEEIRREVE